MGFLSALFGRVQPVPPKLETLFALIPAAQELEACLGFKPTGFASVCFRAVEEAPFGMFSMMCAIG